MLTNRQNCRKTLIQLRKMSKHCKRKIQINRKTVKKQSNRLEKCKKIVKNIEKSSNMSKTRCKTAQNYVKLSTNRQKCQKIVKNVEKL